MCRKCGAPACVLCWSGVACVCKSGEGVTATLFFFQAYPFAHSFDFFTTVVICITECRRSCSLVGIKYKKTVVALTTYSPFHESKENPIRQLCHTVRFRAFISPNRQLTHDDAKDNKTHRKKCTTNHVYLF